MRYVAILSAALLVAGCSSGDTVLRIQVVAAGTSTGAPIRSLRVTLFGDTDVAAPRIVSPVALPGVIVVHNLPSTISSMCVQIESFDGTDTTGTYLGSGTATVTLARHATTNMTVRIGDSPPFCGTLADMAGGGGDDLSLPAGDDGGTQPDMGAVAICPSGALFCDDFESADLGRWSAVQVKYQDMGSVTPSMTHAAHGVWSAHALGSGDHTAGVDNYVELEKDFPAGLMPPLAIRANYWLASTLGAYTMILALYDNTVHGFSMGGDNSNHWVITEDQTTTGQPDRTSNVPTPGPGWHCVELVIDAAGNVTGYIDGTAIIGPFPRFSAVAYTGIFFGIPRVPVANVDVYVDDVAIGPTRLYCPP